MAGQTTPVVGDLFLINRTGQPVLTFQAQYATLLKSKRFWRSLCEEITYDALARNFISSNWLYVFTIQTKIPKP